MGNTFQQSEEVYFIAYDYFPVREDSEGNVYRCTIERAEMWGIYAILNDRTLHHLFDVSDKFEASEVVKMMEYCRIRTLDLISEYTAGKGPWVTYDPGDFINGVIRSSLTS